MADEQKRAPPAAACRGPQDHGHATPFGMDEELADEHGAGCYAARAS